MLWRCEKLTGSVELGTQFLDPIRVTVVVFAILCLYCYLFLALFTFLFGPYVDSAHVII